MKTFRWFLRSSCSLGVSILTLALGPSGIAQTVITNPLIPVVTVEATQRIATTSYPGEFTIYRAGNTNATLNVWYDLSGAASNGVDYATIPPHLVTIPAGATSSTIVITPLTNPLPSSAAKTVVLQLTNSPLMTPINYEIGLPSRAVVYIEATNPPPVGIIDPLEGMMFYTPTNIQIMAFLNDVNWLTNVEFFAGANDLGKGILGLGTRGGLSWLTWTNPPVGNYALTAVASYNDLAWTGTNPPVGYYAVTSAPVNIMVQLPPTNLPPSVRIIEPQDGNVFYTPTNIQIVAKASDPDGLVTNVEFFAGTKDLGPGISASRPAGHQRRVGSMYFLSWNNPPAGDYPLTAVATDNDGASTTSDPVNITVLEGLPTNLPPAVRIISPPNGSVFRAPMNIPIFAYANDPDGFVTSVEFFAGTNNLGFGQRVPLVTPLPLARPPVALPVPPIYPTNLFFLVWSNAPVGTDALTAVATDNGGLSTVSAPVNIAILPSLLPPPTNRPPIVSIVATDPVAIEGTNSWIWRGDTNSPPTWAAWPTAVCRFYTNCAPKTATFTVRRCGDTNNDLTVPYDIGGTASNGVDYVALPGSVTIPAGERRALITIVPIDDGPPDVNKTVILTLLPDMQMNPLPGYVLGFPRRAAAIIIDSNGPHPATGMLPGKCFHFVTPGPDAAWFCIEYSTNLINWTSVCTNQVINGSIDFIDPDSASNQTRFYRAVPLTSPPSD